MSQVLKQVTVLVVLCITLKQSFAFSPLSHFVLEYKSIWKINVGEFSILDVLSCPPDTILCLCASFLSRFLLPNPEMPVLDRIKVEVTPERWLLTTQFLYCTED